MIGLSFHPEGAQANKRNEGEGDWDVVDMGELITPMFSHNSFPQNFSPRWRIDSRRIATALGLLLHLQDFISNFVGSIAPPLIQGGLPLNISGFLAKDFISHFSFLML